jgi:MFS family permease
VIGALFILPFLLFSATSGQLADKYDKRSMVLFVKWLESRHHGAGGDRLLHRQRAHPAGLHLPHGPALHAVRPVKFAYLPQHLDERELTGGNGMVEMGTFVAILLGNVAGGLIVAIPHVGRHWVGAACIALARRGAWWRNGSRPRRRSIPVCGSTGIPSPRPGAT